MRHSKRIKTWIKINRHRKLFKEHVIKTMMKIVNSQLNKAHARLRKNPEEMKYLSELIQFVSIDKEGNEQTYPDEPHVNLSKLPFENKDFEVSLIETLGIKHDEYMKYMDDQLSVKMNEMANRNKESK